MMSSERRETSSDTIISCSRNTSSSPSTRVSSTRVSSTRVSPSPREVVVDSVIVDRVEVRQKDMIKKLLLYYKARDVVEGGI